MLSPKAKYTISYPKDRSYHAGPSTTPIDAVAMLAARHTSPHPTTLVSGRKKSKSNEVKRSHPHPHPSSTFRWLLVSYSS